MIGPFVVDTSIVGTWCFQDEATPETDELLDRLQITHVEVPSLFALEVQSMLRKGEKKGRISPDGSTAFWARLIQLDIRCHCDTSLSEQPLALELARKHGLTPYDAAYLELASQLGLPLATLDGELRAACKSVDIVVLP